jgi:hypothetical protein
MVLTVNVTDCWRSHGCEMLKDSALYLENCANVGPSGALDTTSVEKYPSVLTTSDTARI